MLLTDLQKAIAELCAASIMRHEFSDGRHEELMSLGFLLREANNGCCGCGWAEELADILENAAA